MSEPTSPEAPTPCFSCGRCCYGPTDYVQLFEDDLLRLGPQLRLRLVTTRPDSDRLYLRMEDGHCAALDLSGGQFRCSIYEQRPLICRIYQLYGPSSACPPPPKPPAPPAAVDQGVA